MKKIQSLIISFFMAFSSTTIFALADQKEMRAAWISTVYNMDWPTTKNNPTKQKQEYINLLDSLKSVGINTVVVQVRPTADAFYKSDINPWSKYLTGTQGKNPGYDPLPFLIDEAHKRGMEFHAWFNPYRITTDTTDLNKLAKNHPARLHPDWVLTYKNSKYNALLYNPGLPEVRKHVVDTVREVVRNYDIDGVHFDDYFYRDGMNDDATYKKFAKDGQSKANWRRENVNSLLKDVKSAIKGIKPNVVFGVSPSGIWRNKSNDNTGSDTKGFEHYSESYADSRTWIRQGLVDYIVPQLYWKIGYSPADYSKLVSWWSNEVKGYDVDLYIGQGVYKDDVASEIKKQVELNRKYSQIKGSMYFTSENIVKNNQLRNDMKDLYINNQPIIPTPSINIKELSGENRFETASKISKEGWKSGANTVILSNGYSVVDGVTATPLASVNDAPILLVEKDNIPEPTKDELKRLNPKNIIIIGGEGVVSQNVYNDLKSILPTIKTKRIGGNTRFETSLNIAKEIGYKGYVNKIYVAGGYGGEVDALSIAAKAGMDKQPIILTDKDNLDKNTYEWLKSKNLQDAYFIGGSAVLSDNVINKVNSITSNNVLNNRIFGDNRYDTNAKVIEKFYKDKKYDCVLVAKGNPVVDALSAGPLSSKLNSPIILLGEDLSNLQNNILNSKNADKVYKIGGGINDKVFNNMVNLIK